MPIHALRPFARPRHDRVRTLAASTVLAVLLLALPLVASAAPPPITEAEVYVSNAILDIEERKYDQAAANLQRALEVDPNNVEALYYMGVVRLAQGRPTEAVTYLERARTAAPRDPAVAVQLGLAYMAQQDYDRARPLLEEAFRTDPTLDGLGYYVGFLRYRSKDYQGALKAFRGGRTADPELQQLSRVYSGLSLTALGLPSQAAAEVEEALRLAPGSAITGPAERLRDAVVAARRSDRRFSLEIRVGVLYDDNVRVLPDSAGPGGDPLASQITRGDTTSFGELFGLRADYVWLRTPEWESSVGYSFFMTYYNDVPSFRVFDNLVALTTVYKTSIAGTGVNIGGQYAFDSLFLGDDEFIRRHTVTLFANIVPGEKYFTQVAFRYQNKEFNETQPTARAEIRDADNYMIGILQFFRFQGDRHYLKLGYQFDYDATEGRNYEYRGNRLLAGAQYTLPWYDIRLKYDFDVHFRSYLHRNTIVPSNAPGTKHRHDAEMNHSVRAEVPLPANFTMAAEYLRTDAYSNLDIFDYTRNVFSLTLSWVY
jgi:tetratricopeptide (TPR) repeat protein